MALVALAVALAALLGAPAADAATPPEAGVTPTKVVLGGTVPLTGDAAALGSVGPGALAYFRWVNAHGGVNGRTIDYRFYDDALDPARTLQLTRRLVEQDRVLAVFNSVGTPTNAAVQPWLNQLQVPQLFVRDGSQAVGNAARYPWTVGFAQSYQGEGAVYGRRVVKTDPSARIAVLYENSTLGKDLLRGLERALAGKGPHVVAKESYEVSDTDVSAQLARLKATYPETLMLFGRSTVAIQAFAGAHRFGWTPQVYLAAAAVEPGTMAIARANAPELTKGALSIAWMKDPNDVASAKDPTVALYRRIMKTYAKGRRASDAYHWYGMAAAWTMVETLRRAGRNLTRASLLAAARRLDLAANPFLLPGIRLQTSATSSFPVRQVYLYRYDNRRWARASGPLDARG